MPTPPATATHHETIGPLVEVVCKYLHPETNATTVLKPIQERLEDGTIGPSEYVELIRRCLTDPRVDPVTQYAINEVLQRNCCPSCNHFGTLDMGELEYTCVDCGLTVPRV